MGFKFPEVSDLPLERPPLVEVVCQVRFLPILRIGADDPVEFQDRIRQRFPNFTAERPMGSIRLEIVSGDVREPRLEVPAPSYRFSSIDQTTAVTLSRDSYALVTNNYRGWPRFVEDLTFVSDIVQTIYEPVSVTRIGLRYINRLTNENTQTASIEELLRFPRDEIRALMVTDAWNDPRQVASEILLSNADAQLRVRYGLQQDDVPSLLLDFDHYEVGDLSLDDVIPKATAFHDVIYSAFRWSVSIEELAVFGIQDEKGVQSECTRAQ